jgi:sugar transferase (PEP-CTERM/EpsH1 system associated)
MFAPLICHVIHRFESGGLENGLVNLLNSSQLSGFRHSILCIEASGVFAERLLRDDIRIIELNRSTAGLTKMRLAIWRYCRDARPSILHTRNLSALDAQLPAKLACQPKIIHSEHGWDMRNVGGTPSKDSLLRRVHRPLTDHYIALSDEIAHYLYSSIKVKKKNVSTINNGVDTHRFTAPSVRGQKELLPEKFQSNCVVLGTVGRLDAVKDQKSLLYLLKRLRDESKSGTPEIKLVIVGGGPVRDELFSLTTQLDLTEHVWMPGVRQDIPELLQQFDVFMLPSLMEGMSNVVLEAMATGLPVIATDVGANSKLLELIDGVGLYRVSDFEELVKQVTQLIYNPKLARDIGQNNKQRALHKFSLDAMTTAYAKVYANYAHSSDSSLGP